MQPGEAKWTMLLCADLSLVVLMPKGHVCPCWDHIACMIMRRGAHSLWTIVVTHHGVVPDAAFEGDTADEQVDARVVPVPPRHPQLDAVNRGCMCAGTNIETLVGL